MVFDLIFYCVTVHTLYYRDALGTTSSPWLLGLRKNLNIEPRVISAPGQRCSRQEMESICSDLFSISYPESSGSLVSGLVARRDSGEMEFFQFFGGLGSGCYAHD